jgi:hypothetical protein
MDYYIALKFDFNKKNKNKNNKVKSKPYELTGKKLNVEHFMRPYLLFSWSYQYHSLPHWGLRCCQKWCSRRSLSASKNRVEPNKFEITKNNTLLYTPRRATLRYVTKRYFTLRYVTLRNVTLLYITLRKPILPWLGFEPGLLRPQRRVLNFSRPFQMKWLPKTHIFESPASTSWPSTPAS